MKLTTTLNRIRAESPCAEGWKKGIKALGENFDPNAEINLLDILESNGAIDMLWCLRATVQDSRRITAQLAIKFAEQALLIYEARYPDDNRPRAAIQGAKNFLAGKISREELLSLKSAASACAYAASACAADAAADAACAADAAASCAYAAADAATGTAAVDAAAAQTKAHEKQSKIIKTILTRE